MRITESSPAVHVYDTDIALEDTSDIVFIAFARVFAGTLHANTTQLHIIANANATDSTATTTTTTSTLVTVGQLYVFMGKELQPVHSVPAGNVLGIAGYYY